MEEKKEMAKEKAKEFVNLVEKDDALFEEIQNSEIEHVVKMKDTPLLITSTLRKNKNR